MDYYGCENFVDELVCESSAEFGPAYVIRDDVREKLGKVCELVDEIVPELECNSLDISVNMDTKQFTIMIVCDDMILENGRTHKFFEIIKMLDSFAFSKCGEESLRIELNIDGIWEKSGG